MKRLVVIAPLTWPQVSARVFASFVEMICKPIEGVEIIPLVNRHGPNLDFCRNDAVDRALTGLKADYLMWCDLDQIFPPMAISGLYKSISELFPVVTGLYYRKAPPHRAVVGHYSSWNPNLEKYRLSLDAKGFISPDGQQCLFYQAAKIPKDSFRVDVMGMGLVLMKASVFSKLQTPYFRYLDGYKDGDFTFGNISEDMWMCRSLKIAGVPILCDPRVKAGHLAEIIVMNEETDHGPTANAPESQEGGASQANGDQAKSPDLNGQTESGVKFSVHDIGTETGAVRP